MNAAPRGLPRVSSSRLRARSSRRVVGGGSSPRRSSRGESTATTLTTRPKGVGWASPRARVSRRRPARETREVDARRRMRESPFRRGGGSEPSWRDRIRRRTRRPSPVGRRRRRRRRAAPRAIGFAPSLPRTASRVVRGCRRLARARAFLHGHRDSLIQSRHAELSRDDDSDTGSEDDDDVSFARGRRDGHAVRTASPRVEGSTREQMLHLLVGHLLSLLSRRGSASHALPALTAQLARAAPFHVGFAKCSCIARDTSSARFAARTTRRAPPRPRPIAIPRRRWAARGRCRNRPRGEDATGAEARASVGAGSHGARHGKSRLGAMSATRATTTPVRALPPSRYDTDFQEIRPLGRGAFGRAC